MRRRDKLARQAQYHKLTFVIAAVTSVCAVGCVGSDITADGASDTPPDAPDTVYRTIIRFAPDGSPTQTIDAITVAEQQAELVARAALVEARSGGGGEVHPQALPTLGVDTGCVAASLWLFDQPNLAGNELCLFKASTDSMAWLDLGTRCRTRWCLTIGTGTWANAVSSLWAGSDPGSLLSCTTTLCATTPFVGFGAYQKITNVAPSGLNWAFLFTP